VIQNDFRYLPHGHLDEDRENCKVGDGTDRLALPDDVGDACLLDSVDRP
jgi:hypothetical protein